jgi:Ca-activated chloride channel family protein
MIRLAYPYALLGLLLLPLCLAFQRRQQPSAISFPAIQELAALPPSMMTRLRRLLPWMRAIVLILVVVALARPQQGLQVTKLYSEGIAIAVVVDISGSMRALDLTLNGQQQNRLEVVKHTFRHFVRGGNAELSGRGGDMIGMVTFARYADSISPLTLDHDTLLALLDQVQIVSLTEEDGTAIGEAIALGIERLRDAKSTSKVMILLTDGANNAGETEPVEAAKIAQAMGIKIYTIGTGTRGVAPVPVRTADGHTVLQRMRVFIDERTLTDIAKTTGGRYFRATDTSALQEIYGEINRLEKSANVLEHYQQYAERFAWFLLPALGLLLIELLLINTRLRTIP